MKLVFKEQLKFGRASFRKPHPVT